MLNEGFEPGVPDIKSPADWILADKPTELSRIKLKTWTRQPVPMISEHSAHLTPLSVDFRTWLWRYTYLLLLILMIWHRQAIYIHTYIHTCLLLLISMLWYRQVIFESKGDKLSSSAECRIRAQGLRHLFASRLNACWQTDWAIEDQAKTWTRQPVPMISEHSAASTPHSHLALAIYMFAVVNFDALAQASDIRIEMRQVVFLCRIRTHQGLRHQIASRLNARWQTDWAIEDQAKTWTRQPVPMISEHSANSTPQPFGIHTWLWR